MEITYQFVNYGTDLLPEKDTIVLDVGMKTVPGVIDHHHPQAEPECTASLIAKYPRLVLDHLKTIPRKIITHRLPDFDALASIFLTLKLIETSPINPFLDKMASYTKMVDSASLPKKIDLSSTPYSILRALFAGAKKEEEKINQERIEEGLRFMNFLYIKSKEGYEITENRLLFSGVDRYERAMRKTEDDYFTYLRDLSRAHRVSLFLPAVSAPAKKKVDGLLVRNPRSFLLKEWARRDRESSPLREGFSLLLTNFSNQRYIIGVDPEQGVNLRGLGEMLNSQETERRKAQGRALSFRWYDGNCPFFNFRIVDSPQDGTALSHQEIVETLEEYGKLPDSVLTT